MFYIPVVEINVSAISQDLKSVYSQILTCTA